MIRDPNHDFIEDQDLIILMIIINFCNKHIEEMHK